MRRTGEWTDGERERVTLRLRAAGCVFAEDEAAILLDSAEDPADLDRKLRRREAGTPLEHVVGWADFRGVRVRVSDGVFIPRSRSAALVDEAVRRLSPGARLVEICCGSGALALACSVEVRGLRIVVSDIDENAVRCAAENLSGIGTVVCGDLFSAIPAEFRGSTDVVIANVPYVPTAGLELVPRDIVAGEPLHTRHGGPDGLEIFRRVVGEITEWMEPSGCLVSELHESQAVPADNVVQKAGLRGHVIHGEHGQAVIVVRR